MMIICIIQRIEDVYSQDNILDLIPYENFMFALKSSETRDSILNF